MQDSPTDIAEDQESSLSSKSPAEIGILLVSVGIIAICGILYELLISSITSYFQGSSITHFSIVIGLFLSFMGVGSYLSKFIRKDLLQWFVRFEILLGIIGGVSAGLLYAAFSLTPYFYAVAFLLIASLGCLIGLEIPILTRVMREFDSLKDAVANVLAFDYLGSLVASVAFPLILLPFLGIMRTSFFIGILNLCVAAVNIWVFRNELKQVRSLFVNTGLSMLLLIVGFAGSFQINGFFEQFLFKDEVMLSKQSTYQHMVLTKRNQDIRLFINGNLQFASVDEHRYHEPLVHVPMTMALKPEKVLILGGGDGLALREVWKHQEVQHVDLVDLDPEMTHMGTRHPVFTRLNQSSMLDPRLTVYNQDAFQFVEKSSNFYDVIIIDLPDPNHVGLGKLYAKSFYELIRDRLSQGGVMVTQSTSPYFARPAFWCIHETVKSVFPTTVPYQVYVPSFGQWGFNLAMKTPGRIKAGKEVSPAQDQMTDILGERLFADSTITYQFLAPNMIPALFTFGADVAPVPVEVNQMDNQQLVRYYDQSWEQW
ncbi:polyamine aminopropyltransferase [Pontibacter sp. G13]|uniref:polyamine aminopropyltransferase n=1 Tax=Pontibacter sp. G13 TaxID=3074898 RepID=UPI00288A6F3E|nr:polyamine aminopropyltransferase [Pontibacter sp. G13]WNJ15982.1 polyamine aminopropyltransferase [Pontibacter sp. G13]